MTIPEIRGELELIEARLLGAQISELLTKHHQASDLIDEAQHLTDQEMAASETTIRAKKLRQVQHALRLLESQTAGVCEDCEESISDARFRAVPWATRCVECQAKLEMEAKESAGSRYIPRPCDDCGKEISAATLKAEWWATRCALCQAKVDEQFQDETPSVSTKTRNKKSGVTAVPAPAIQPEKRLTGREKSIAILEHHAALPQQGHDAEWLWFMEKFLWLSPCYQPAVREVLRQGKWRAVEYPMAYVKKAALRSASRLGLADDPREKWHVPLRATGFDDDEESFTTLEGFIGHAEHGAQKIHQQYEDEIFYAKARPEEKLVETIPHAQLRRPEDAGLLLNFDQPEDLAKLSLPAGAGIRKNRSILMAAGADRDEAELLARRIVLELSLDEICKVPPKGWTDKRVRTVWRRANERLRNQSFRRMLADAVRASLKERKAPEVDRAGSIDYWPTITAPFPLGNPRAPHAVSRWLGKTKAD